MPLSPDERSFLKRLYQGLADKPLRPGSPLYEPVYQGAAGEDPIQLLSTHIEYSDVESLQMFSGFRGSGKTTELLRLKQDLETQGCVVLYADALDYVNPAEPIDISDLLITLAGSFGDALEKEGISIKRESFWDRTWNYLVNTEVELKEVGIKPELLSPIKSGIDLKLALKTAPTFRQRLQSFLAARIGELRNQLVRFVEDGVTAVREARGRGTKVVFLFDSLEQLRGSVSNEQSVIQSVERVFSSHLPLLELPYVHVVYTVPPWLQFVTLGGNITILPSVRQWNNDPHRSEYAPGMNCLRELVVRRFEPEGMATFFGDPARADQLINLCGGHFRDLLLLLRETVLRARSLPVSDEAIHAAILSVRSNFLPIAVEDALWLHRIDRSRATCLQSTATDEVARLTRFLDTHFVLYLMNGTEWYDVHPLVRDEVSQIVASNPPASAG